MEMFTYDFLSTLTGTVTATVLVVEFLKELGPIKKIPTRWVVFAVSEMIVIITSIARGNFGIINLPLYFLNGLLVTTLAMGSWHLLCYNLRDITVKHRIYIPPGRWKTLK
ncbi:hypothetical protein [Thermosediminibacter oceani]|uniref:Uncharacterized protein n=1 Tax=Thermosediminibacter oceani (strain ATCC BAA-1034 / DSM 16646 / JW/IW-1228P) TaxID=555079 RepID=D9S1Y9_THEOJ|nr:hypothetical protein [Thermosediminibacter oceani]ADL07416.1 hypothetical protein Toce_0644 [Thermosediminibacter oceani DSM 16646]